VIGRTTQSQMLIGIYWGYVAMIEGLAERIKRELGRPVTAVVSYSNGSFVRKPWAVHGCATGYCSKLSPRVERHGARASRPPNGYR